MTIAITFFITSRTTLCYVHCPFYVLIVNLPQVLKTGHHFYSLKDSPSSIVTDGHVIETVL